MKPPEGNICCLLALLLACLLAPAALQAAGEDETDAPEPYAPVVQRVVDVRPTVKKTQSSKIRIAQRWRLGDNGSWLRTGEDGQPLGSGAYRNGKPHGEWVRNFRVDEIPMPPGSPFHGFTAPLTARATFADGKLHGDWTLTDALERTACRWQFDQGVAHGKAVWWYPHGKQRREVELHSGKVQGVWREWDQRAKLTRQEEYVSGKRLTLVERKYKNGRMQLQGSLLAANQQRVPEFDWWSGKAELSKRKCDGSQQRHGRWTWWYPSGQKRLDATYDEGKLVGRFVAWYETGQRQMQGRHVAGNRDGRFVWWFPNGQKQLVGDYRDGEPIGNWSRWASDGVVLDPGPAAAGSLPSPHRQPVLQAMTPSSDKLR